VLTQCTSSDTHTLRTRYNVKAGGATDLSLDGTNVRHVVNATNNNEELQPGEHFQVNTSVQVPQGVQSGEISGYLRVFVNSLVA